MLQANSIAPVGPWVEVFTQTEVAVVCLMKTLVTEWKRTFTPLTVKDSRLRDIQALRHVKDLRDIALRCALYMNLLRPLVQRDLGDKGCEFSDEEWYAGHLTSELSTLVEARAKAELYVAVKLASMPDFFH